MYLTKTLDVIARSFNDYSAPNSVIVQHDANVDGIIFFLSDDIPDITEQGAIFTVLYKLPRGNAIYADTLDVRYSDINHSFLHATWDFPHIVTSQAGSVTYHICIQRVVNNVITHEWHSQKSSFSVLPSYNHTDSNPPEDENERQTNAEAIAALATRVVANETSAAKFNAVNRKRNRVIKDVCPCNTLAEFDSALERGYDYVAFDIQATSDNVIYVTSTGKVNGNKDIWTVADADITDATRPLSYFDALNYCAEHGLGVCIRLVGTHLSQDVITKAEQLVAGHEIPHFYLSNTSASRNLYRARRANINCEVVLTFGSVPTLNDITTSQDAIYQYIRQMAQEDGKTAICYDYTNSAPTEEFITGIYALGIGFVTDGNMSPMAMKQGLKYSRYIINSAYTASEVWDFVQPIIPIDAGDDVVVGG
jgi:hypothetical protein